MMNRKGDLPTILLFVATLVLMVFALFSFVTFEGGFGEKSGDFAEVVGVVEFNQKYMIKKGEMIARESIKSGEEDLKNKFMEISAEKDIGYSGADVFFEKISKGEFSFLSLGNEYLLSVEDMEVSHKVGENSVNRSFDMEMRFDSEGKVLRIE
jgi:hypothetical protein